MPPENSESAGFSHIMNPTNFLDTGPDPGQPSFPRLNFSTRRSPSRSLRRSSERIARAVGSSGSSASAMAIDGRVMLGWPSALWPWKARQEPQVWGERRVRNPRLFGLNQRKPHWFCVIFRGAPVLVGFHRKPEGIRSVCFGPPISRHTHQYGKD